MKTLNNFTYKILSLEEKFLRFCLRKTIGAKNYSKKKRHYFNGCMVDFTSLAEVEKQKFESEITLILEQCGYEPEKLLKLIEKQGTRVIYMDSAYRILNPIGENEGFIYPAKGSKGLYLSLAVNKQIGIKTDEMFVLSKGEINKYYFLYHFYNWFAFKKNINGIDSEAHELLNQYLYNNSETKNLQLSDIYKLKDAIQQDKSAIEFVIKLCRNYDGTKQAIKKMQENGSANL